jgi:hypothetical protein
VSVNAYNQATGKPIAGQFWLTQGGAQVSIEVDGTGEATTRVSTGRWTAGFSPLQQPSRPGAEDICGVEPSPLVVNQKGTTEVSFSCQLDILP